MDGDAVCVVNPEIVKMEGEVHEREGCMSVYAPQDVTAAVKRPALTRIRAINRDGEPVEIERDGYLAKLFQHEQVGVCESDGHPLVGAGSSLLFVAIWGSVFRPGSPVVSPAERLRWPS